MSKIKRISLKLLKQLKADGYMGQNGFDYWDFQVDIDHRIWELEDRLREKEFKKRMEEEELYKFYNFELEDTSLVEWANSNFRFLMDVGFYQKNNV